MATTLRCELLILVSMHFVCVTLFLLAAVTVDHNNVRKQTEIWAASGYIHVDGHLSAGGMEGGTGARSRRQQ